MRHRPLTLIAFFLLSSQAAAQARWTRIDHLPERSAGAMVYDPSISRVLLIGGRAPSGTMLDDQWTWDGVDWTRMHPTRVPPARDQAGIACDLQRGRVILFGGVGQSGWLNDTWEWDGLNWTLAFPGNTPASPASRGNPLLANDLLRRRTVLHEGTSTHEWDGTTWTLMSPAHLPVPPRDGAAMSWHLPSGRVVLFGGSSYPGMLADTWTWDGVDWRQESPAQSPLPRGFAGMTQDWTRGRVIVSSGKAQSSGAPPHNDAWEWDGANWQPLATAQPLPAREGARLTYDMARNRLVQFGGGTGPFNVQSDVWEHDGSNWAMVSTLHPTPPSTYVGAAFDATRSRVVLHAADGSTWEQDGVDWSLRSQTGPPPRTRFGLVYDRLRQRTVLYGGGEILGLQFNDLWEWDGATWTQRQPPVSPPARANAAVAYDSGRGRMVMYGGWGLSTPLGMQLFADTWEWDGNNWQQMAVASGPAGVVAMAYDTRRQRTVMFGGSNLGGTWEWDGNSWTQAAASQPSLRPSCSLAYDEVQGCTVMLGGNPAGASSGTDEVWEWNGSFWLRQTVATPPRRSDAALAFDEARGHLLLCGGYYNLSWLRDTWRFASDRPPAFAPFGAGCPASNGVPRLARAAGMPSLGDTLGLGLENVAPGALAVLCFGTRLPLPVALAPMPGCSAHIDVTANTDLRSAGNTRWDITLPLAPWFVGSAFHCQGLVFDAAVNNPLRAAVSNAATATVGLR